MAICSPYFIDFEASSLSFDSYPIEVAWGSDVSNVESYLISPQHVTQWTDWSKESQLIHGISQEELLLDGKEPDKICNKIYSALDGKRVYSDASPFDMDWLSKLFYAANLPLPNFTIRDIDELLIAEIVCVRNDIEDISQYIDGLKKEARIKIRNRHRAYYDVQYLIELMNLAKL